mgnify:FL=1
MATTIQIDEKLKDKLDKLKVHHRESYNDLIVRLISNSNSEEFDRESLIETIEVLSDPELMKGLREALEEEAKGEKGTTFEELKKEL